MAEAALRTLHHRSDKLRNMLCSGTQTEVKAAREMVRLSLVELYGLGYWQAHPEQLRDYMRLYRKVEASAVTAPESSSELGRMARYSL